MCQLLHGSVSFSLREYGRSTLDYEKRSEALVTAAEVCSLRPIDYFIYLCGNAPRKWWSLFFSFSFFFVVDEAAFPTGTTDDDDDKEKIGNRTKEIYRLTRNNINTRKDASNAEWHIDAIEGDDGRNYPLPRLDAHCSSEGKALKNNQHRSTDTFLFLLSVCRRKTAIQKLLRGLLDM